MRIFFTPKTRSQAISIMNEISKHPCAKPFLNFDESKKSMINDNVIIKNPISINIIINKLKNDVNSYSEVEEWFVDVNLIYINATKLYCYNSPIISLAKTFLQIFHKKYKIFMAFIDQISWLQRYGSIMKKIRTLTNEIPKSIQIKNETDQEIISQ